MYPADGGGPGQHPHQAQSSQRSWDPSPQHQYRNDPASQPLNGGYPPRPDQQQHPSSFQAPQIRPDRPEMTSIHPQYYQQPPGPYLPAPSSLYGPPPPADYRQPPPPQQQPAVGQSAPRQRTAIACKYCRRRKIRCSGFENSEDGRCSNCVRFSQECVFTPVSAQTQAFVPAQALYGRGGRGAPPGPPQQLYGPYGNRLPPQQEHYGPPQGYALPSPTGAYPPPPGQYPYPPPQPYDQSAGRRRPRDEPHPATAAPPNPAHGSHMADRRDSHGGPPPGYAYPDPSGYPHGAGGSPASAAPYGSHPQPYYAGGALAPRRHSPGSSSHYSYDPSRESNSPHGPAYGYPPSSGAGQQPYQPGPGQPQATSGRTPPPLSAGERGRSGMSIHDIVGGENGTGGRSAADSSMVSALDNRAKR